MIRDPVAVVLVLAAVVFLALWLEERFAFFRALGAALVGILIGMALSNSGVLPGTSPTYQWLSSQGVNLSVALILINVDLRSLTDAGMSMLAAFGIGAASTAAGAVIGALLWSDRCRDRELEACGPVHRHLHGRRNELRSAGACLRHQQRPFLGGNCRRRNAHRSVDGGVVSSHHCCCRLAAGPETLRPAEFARRSRRALLGHSRVVFGRSPLPSWRRW